MTVGQCAKQLTLCHRKLIHPVVVKIAVKTMYHKLVSRSAIDMNARTPRVKVLFLRWNWQNIAVARKKWYEDDSDFDSVSSSSSRLSDEQNTAESMYMYCEDHNRDTLSVDSDKIVSVNVVCVVCHQEIKSSKINEALEATCNLFSGIVGLLKAAQLKVI